MQEINLEVLASDITDSVYYKRLQKQLTEKQHALKKQAEKSPTSDQTPSQKHIQDNAHSATTHPSKKSKLNDDYFKDQVMLTSQQLHAELDQDDTSPIKSDSSEQDSSQTDSSSRDFIERLKYNGIEIIRHLSHKINFSARQNELKEMYKFNIQESKSHNLFVSRFSGFKVGIVGQILSGIGVPVSELRKLKKEALSDLFDENRLEMNENIYNSELLEILHGNTRKSKHSINMFTTLKQQLVKKMNNLGRIGFWSSIRLHEERISQCEKIKHEFEQEKEHLTYLLRYIYQNHTPKTGAL